MILGKDVIIHDSVIIVRPQFVKIGNHVAIDPFCYFTTALDFGNYIHISSHVSVIGGEKGLFVMKDFTTVSAGSRLICGSDDFAGGTGFINPFISDKYKSEQKIAPIIMEKFSALGTSVIVFPGVTIGEGAVIGAGSVVTHSVKPWTVNIGIPAKFVKIRPKEKLLEYEKEIKKRKQI